MHKLLFLCNPNLLRYFQSKKSFINTERNLKIIVVFKMKTVLLQYKLYLFLQIIRIYNFFSFLGII